ncbi:hypothetical protein Dimus_016148, partial [Dionaea muscipula]
EIFGAVADLYGLSALEARKVILGPDQEVGAESSTTVGEGTMEMPAGTSTGTRRRRSSSPSIEVLKPKKRRKKGRALQEKGQEPIEGEREKGAVIKTQAGHGEENELSGREQAEAGGKPGAEEVDPSIMKDVMEVFERDESSMASQAPPKEQQKLQMATGEEKRLKCSVAVTQVGHGEGSAAMTAQVVKGIGKGKSGAKEAKRKCPCPNVEPTESILHTDVAWETKFRSSESC